MDNEQLEEVIHDSKEICDDPDLILIVGPDKQRIGVDSRCLRRTSKVFNTMFKPPWMESTKISNIATNDIAKLALPEDDFLAMYTICCILHHRSDLVSSEISASEILQIATAVDKYDMFSAMKYATSGWLKSTPKSGTPEAEIIISMGHLLVAAYLLRERERFRDISLELMFNYAESYQGLGNDSQIVGILGSDIPVVLEERRTRIRTELHQMLIDDAARGCSCERHGTLRSAQYQALLASKSNGPLSMLQKPIRSLLKEIEDTTPSRKDLDKDLDAGSCNSYIGPDHIDERNHFNNKLEGLKTAWALSYEEIRSRQAAEMEN
ncbi:hypothetical protein QBC39DRAFT_355756 [Podospora conica]|nr:hypothetical protein QBC39DRAFT_355756 [Schizothecium conicum]